MRPLDGADARVTTGSICEDYPAAEVYNRRIMDCIRHHVGPMLAQSACGFRGHGDGAKSGLTVRLAAHDPLFGIASQSPRTAREHDAFERCLRSERRPTTVFCCRL